MTSQYVARVLRVAGLGFLAATFFASASLARECKSDAVAAEGEPALSRDLGAYQNSDRKSTRLNSSH